MRSTSTARAVALIAMAAAANAASAPVYQGCYSVSTPMTNKGTYQFQTSGWCQGVCLQSNQAVLGVSDANQCWCGNEMPPLSSKVDDSKCNTPCDGYDQDMCGGINFWGVYTTGLVASVQHASGSGSSGNPSSSSITSAPTTVVTKVSGTTVVYTQTAATSAATSSHSSHSGGVNTAAVAAGVVVTIVVVTAAVAGIFIWLRYRKRREAEEEYQRAQVAELQRSASKPPPTSWSSMSDSRLEPAIHDRRNSHGSIADNEDYSRKILRVANPDRSSAFNPDIRTSIFPPDRTAGWPQNRS